LPHGLLQLGEAALALHSGHQFPRHVGLAFGGQAVIVDAQDKAQVAQATLGKLPGGCCFAHHSGCVRPRIPGGLLSGRLQDTTVQLTGYPEPCLLDQVIQDRFDGWDKTFVFCLGENTQQTNEFEPQMRRHYSPPALVQQDQVSAQPGRESNCFCLALIYFKRSEATSA